MEDDAKTRLLDIKTAVIEINSFLPNKKNFFEFKKDTKTKRAIERDVEIIGEVTRRIIKI